MKQFWIDDEWFKSPNPAVKDKHDLVGRLTRIRDSMRSDFNACREDGDTMASVDWLEDNARNIDKLLDALSRGIF